MMGICRGILYDGKIVDEEIVGLANFIATHQEITSGFPGRDIARRLTRMLADLTIDDRERIELRELLESLVAPPSRPTDFDEHSTRAIFNVPVPTLLFDGHRWVITGRFAFGNRAFVEREITDRGGRVESAVSGWVHYVLVGAFASPSWRQSQWGNKISEAVELRDRGYKIAIVSEQHWREAISLDE